MASKAIMFGLNYVSCVQGRLHGCHNDVKSMSEYLSTTFQIPCQVYNDLENPQDTTGAGILNHLIKIAADSWAEDLEFVWIHYSGHGSYMQDRSGDEADGRDECLVPSDYAKVGLIPDDMICDIFKKFNPKTRVVCVFDCCHSGTIGDVKYSWCGSEKMTVENKGDNTQAKVITISGCLDSQVSMDAFLEGRNIGALTACFLAVMKRDKGLAKDIFALVEKVTAELKARNFAQIPVLCSTYDLAHDKVVVP